MWVVYILLGLVALLLLILLIPVYGRITYDGELQVRVRVLGVPVRRVAVAKNPAHSASSGATPTRSTTTLVDQGLVAASAAR